MEAHDDGLVQLVSDFASLLNEPGNCPREELLTALGCLADLGTLPTSVLRKTSIGKIVNTLGTTPAVDAEVRRSAQSLVSTWRQAFRKTSSSPAAGKAAESFPERDAGKGSCDSLVPSCSSQLQGAPDPVLEELKSFLRKQGGKAPLVAVNQHLRSLRGKELPRDVPAVDANFVGRHLGILAMQTRRVQEAGPTGRLRWRTVEENVLLGGATKRKFTYKPRAPKELIPRRRCRCGCGCNGTPRDRRRKRGVTAGRGHGGNSKSSGRGRGLSKLWPRLKGKRG